MVSDDLTALSAITMGALTSVVVTLSLIRGAPQQEAGETIVVVESCARPASPVDFAIIRGDPEVMVGPEGPATGWERQMPLELRLLRNR
jgi:hypothetical protein